MEQNPYIIIQSLYQQMHRVEKKIADYILNDPSQVVTHSVQELAQKLDIAQSSIIRFCKLVGCSGFTDLKLRLAQQNAPYEMPPTIFEELSASDSMEMITTKVFNRNINTIQNALQGIDFEKVSNAVDLLTKAKKIYIYGLGASASIAEDFYIRLMRVGIESAAVTDSHLCQIASGLLTEEDAVIAISYTGKTTELVRALSVARESGAKTISITGYSRTPISAVSDICLKLYSPEQLFISPRVAQVSLIDSLYVGIAIQQKERVMECVKRMEEVLSPLRSK